MRSLSTAPANVDSSSDATDVISPWRLEGHANGSHQLHIEALRNAARGQQLLGMDAKQWAWIVLHTVLFILLCKTDTYLTARLRGALDWKHFSWYDTSYMLGAIGVIGTAGVMYHNLYASDPGWVQPGSSMDTPERPLCQYCMGLAWSSSITIARFWVYLAVQTFVVLWGLILSASAVSGCFTPKAIRGTSGCWAVAPFRTTVLTMASLFLLSLFLLFGSLWALHTYLLASGQTTYEILKGIAVPYLGTFYAMYRGPHSRQVRYSSIWPELLRRWIVGNAPPAPFNEGVTRNAEMFFFMPKPHDYQYSQQPSHFI